MKEWRKPNFFIIGAPKCGTTAIASYLDEHPEIYISDPKEPDYLNSDMAYSTVSSLQEYASCFRYATKKHKFICDASVGYLYSEKAVESINKDYGNSKLLVMLRNPIDLVYSFYSEQVWSGAENVMDFETAWKLQSKRNVGENIPKLCKRPFLLQYKEIGLLGKYLNKLFNVVDREKIHVVLHEDFVKNPAYEYDRILDFLGVSSMKIEDFPYVNENKKPRNRFVVPAIQWLISIKMKLGNPKFNFGIIKKIIDANSVSYKRTKLDERFREELSEEFYEDIMMLSKLIERNLDHWLVKSTKN